MTNIRDTMTKGKTCLLMGPMRFGFGVVKYNVITFRGLKPF